MNKYFCSKCQCIHYRGKIFKEHKEFNVNLSQYEMFRQEFRQSWNRAKKESKNNDGIVNLPKRDFRKKYY